MKEQSTYKGFAILSMATMAIKIISILYIPFLIHIIGDEGYGVYFATYQAYVFVFVIANAGIPVAISKLVSELVAVGNYKDAVKVFKIARLGLLILGTVMSILMIIFAMPIAMFFNSSQAYYAIIALAPCIIFTTVSSAYRGYFQGRSNMTPTAISQVIEQILNIIFSLLFAFYFMKYGITGGVAGSTVGTTIGALVSAIILIYFYKNNRDITVTNDLVGTKITRYKNKDLIKKIINYSVPITICVGMTYAGNFVDGHNTTSRLIVAGFSGTDAKILYGYLGKYQQLINVPIAIITSLSMAILPAITAATARNDKKSIREKINYSFRICFTVAIPCAAGFAVLNEPIFKLLVLSGGSYLMMSGAIVLVLMAVVQIQSTILQSLNKMYLATIYIVIGIIFKIAINYYLIAQPKINILGAIYGSIVGFIIPLILNHISIKKTLGVKVSLMKHFIKPFISATFMGMVVYVVYTGIDFILSFINGGYFSNAVATIVAVVFGIYTYLFAMILTSGIRAKDFNMLPRKIIKFIPSFMVERIR